jgi:hypothetical protein
MGMASEEIIQALIEVLQAGLTVNATVDESTLAKTTQLPAARGATGATGSLSVVYAVGATLSVSSAQLPPALGATGATGSLSTVYAEGATLPISAIGATGATAPLSAMQVGYSDGTNLQAPRCFDADSGAGSQYVVGAVLRQSGNGGSTEVPFPTALGRAAAAASSAVVLSTEDAAKVPSLGAAASAAATPVTIASDQWDATLGALPIKNKVIATSDAKYTVVQSSALEASHILKASAGALRLFDCRVDSTLASGTYYVQFLVSATLPVDGAVTHARTPIKVIHSLGVDDYVFLDMGINSLYFPTGCVAVLSSTEFTKTIGGAYLSMTAQVA